MRRSRGAAAALFVCLIVAPAAAVASGVPKWSTAQLASFADVIVIGRINELSSDWDEQSNSIYTFVGVSVEQVLKGAVPHHDIVIKQLGGRVGSVGLHVSDQADFHVGETALLFLEVRPRDGTLYTSALWQGKWKVERDASGGGFVVREAPSGTVWQGGDRSSLTSIERAVASSQAGTGKSIEFAPAGHQFAPAAAALTSTHAFQLLGPLRYATAPPVDVQAGGQPGLVGGGTREILAAIGKWNAAGAAFRYALGTADSAPRCSTEELGNGRVTISFMDPCNEMSNEGGTLAIGGSYYVHGGGGSVDWQEFNRASEGFIVTNDGATALRYLTQPGCFEDVQAHELGHVLGLGHSADSTAIMFPTVNAGCAAGPRPLAQDDIAGITYIYGFRSGPGASALASVASPLDLQLTVNGSSSLALSWTHIDAAALEGEFTSYRVDFRQGHQDAAPAVASFTTTATSMIVPLPPGLAGSFSVVATAVVGVTPGPSSLRRDFTLCGDATSAVSGLTASVIGGVARASWDPAAGALTYKIQAGSTRGGDDVYPMSDVGQATSVSAAVGPGFSAWLRVVAVSGCGASAPSDVLIGTP